MAHVAHVKHIGCIFIGFDGVELFRPQPIVNHRVWLAAKANLLRKAPPFELANKNHSRADACQGPFGRQENKAGKRQPLVMQAAAMRRINRRNAKRPSRQPAVKPALGAMPVNDVNAKFLGMLPCARDSRKIAEARQAGNPDARNPKRAVGRNAIKQTGSNLPARRRVADNANLVAKFRLPARQIAHMTEQSTHRSSEHVQDFHGRAAPVRTSAHAHK